MGRHVEASGTVREPRRAPLLAGLGGGLAWVVAWILPGDGSVESALLWVGAVLLTLALFALGLLLVRSELLALRLFVALALPTLVWGVFALVHGSMSDPEEADAGFGAVVALVCALRLARRRGHDASRATL